mmetsp:Transcript_1585/g.3061  ORF Transcript_1585/g.3061 Transcript_1585/m.3061 type:complete len:83 (+) Transcript_1585:921-1169(+)
MAWHRMCITTTTIGPTTATTAITTVSTVATKGITITIENKTIFNSISAAEEYGSPERTKKTYYVPLLLASYDDSDHETTTAH